MPYMTNGKRDYQKENRLFNSKPSERKKRSERSVARVKANKAGITSKGDGKDLDHKKPLSKGGSSERSNLRVVSASSNRSFARNADGSLKSQTSRKERKYRK
jgi:hypothetical protein